MKKTFILSTLMSLAVMSAGAQVATFRSFSYQGQDERFDKQTDPAKEFLNPVLSGFSPDPAICRKGDTYYLVNSSFSFYPGVPIFTSKDLINWKQLGHVLDRPSQLPLKNQGVSGGIFAPAISYNEKNKTFYMITTNVGAGNFYVKSKDPAKGWSEPIYLRKIDGIDPSFFFDKDGKGYIVHNAPVNGKADYEGQRAIRLFEFDTKGDSIKGDYREILRGGTHVDKKPIWIEGPHLFKKDGYYYLICAEGGTGTWHSEVALRAKDPMAPWEECPFNPILTQRTGLSPLRPYPVSSSGHADMVEDKNGQWWAVFLGCRPYEGDMYNTGRDTYLLPVTWRDGWPIILEKNTAIAPIGEKQGLQPQAEPSQLTGNFSYEDTFQEVADGKGLNPRWMYLREPSDFWQIEEGRMTFTPLPGNIYQRHPMSALWVRQQHENFTAETTLRFTPREDRDIAGLALMQKEDYNIVFGKTMIDGQQKITLSRAEGKNALIASAPVGVKPLRLKIEAHGRYYDFLYAEEGDEWQVLAKGVDASNLSTHKSGGFIGACIGLYASAMKN